ncbi:MAG: hypothetical protein WAW06_01265 [bacterium]
MRAKTIPLAVLALALTGSAAHAYIFDALDVSSKARGMGGAWTAGADDASAVYYNPACLPTAALPSLSASYLKPNGQEFEGLAYVALAAPVAKSQAVGVSFRRFGVVGALVFDEDLDRYVERDLLGENTFSVAHGMALMQDIHSSLSVGWCVNIYNLNFGDYSSLGSATTFGLDLGFLGTLRERTKIGFLLKNVNEPEVGKYTKEPLPQWISAGASYTPYYGVTTELDLRALRGEDVEVHMGMQFALTEFLDTRFGFATGPNSLTGGFTLKRGIADFPFEVNYSYSSHSVLPGTHHVSVGLAYIK